jgi:tRNA(Ile)-lysidine synthase
VNRRESPVAIPARILEPVQRCLCSLSDLDRGLVVAVSGGADSVALLRLLLVVRPKGVALVAAHLNHLLRGPESDADEAFVADLCQSLTVAGVEGLTFRCQRMDVAAIAQAEGENLEATARKLRYRFLAEVARSEGMRWIATGHTANDQAETVLHRLLRGTGLQGLRGIAACRQLEPGIDVIRPLLQLSRTDILASLEALKQPYREDSTNSDRDYTRNRIRLELLPHLAQQYNPGIVNVLARLAEQAEAVARSEEQAARVVLQDVEDPRAGTILVLNRGRLGEQSRQRVREVFRLLWLREGWTMDVMNFDAWERLTDLVLLDRSAVDLPGSIHARRRERVILIGPKGEIDSQGQSP